MKERDLNSLEYMARTNARNPAGLAITFCKTFLQAKAAWPAGFHYFLAYPWRLFILQNGPDALLKKKHR
jgi:hypothetical protein